MTCVCFLPEKNVRIPTTESTIEEDSAAELTPKVNGIEHGSDENLVSVPLYIVNKSQSRLQTLSS